MNWHANRRPVVLALAVLTGTGVFLGAIPQTNAAENALALCAIVKPLDQLTTLRNETTNAPKTELALRQELLQATITCALADLDATSAALTDLPLVNDTDKADRDGFLQDIQAARDYYTHQASSTENLRNINESRVAARQIGEWRNAHQDAYWEASEFIALIKNDALMAAADNRLGQMEKLVKPLTLVDGDTISPLLADAHTALDLSHHEQDAAKAALREQPLTPPDTILSHSKTSLGALAGAYDIFFKINDAVKVVVGR